MSAPSPDALLGLLRRVFEQEFEIPPAEVTPEAHLVDDLALDSVDAVSLAVILEQETGLALEEDEIKAMRTVGSVVDIVHRRLGQRPDAGS